MVSGEAKPIVICEKAAFGRVSFLVDIFVIYNFNFFIYDGSFENKTSSPFFLINLFFIQTEDQDPVLLVHAPIR